MIPPAFLQELVARVDIVEVVGRHVELKRGGANWMGLCPFHAEKSPSFSVSPAKQFYYCFGCGASGDAIRFLVEHTGMPFVDAVTELAQGVGLTVPQEQVSPEERERRQRLAERRLTLTAALERAAAHYQAQLKASAVAIDYLKGRGLTGEIAARYRLGYAPPGWRGLAGVFPAYDDPVLEEAGLVRSAAPEGEARSHDGDAGRYDWFRHRVMFPIRSVGGETIGFGGRVLDDSKPKYLNSPETPVFSKGRELYGLFEARQAIRERGQAIVVEGYMDVVALAQAGFGNAVATLGTACTPDHVAKLFRFTDAVVFSFDGDDAGRRAAARALEAALPHASDLRQIRFLFLPPEHDPDSYVRALGPEAFASALEHATPLSRQLVAQAGEGADLDTAEGRARLLAHARPLWQALPDGALQGQVLGELARTAQIEREELAQLWRDAGAGRAAGASRERSERGERGERAHRALHPGAAGALPAPLPATATSTAAPLRSRGRAARPQPPASADLALRLLLRHSSWWDALTADDHQLLHGLGGEHGALVGWIEQQLHDHGPLTWAALHEALEHHDLQPFAVRLADPASLEDRHELADLQRVLHRLWIAELGEQVTLVAHEAGSDREQWARLAALNERIGQHKRALAAPTTGS